MANVFVKRLMVSLYIYIYIHMIYFYYFLQLIYRQSDIIQSFITVSDILKFYIFIYTMSVQNNYCVLVLLKFIPSTYRLSHFEFV